MDDLSASGGPFEGLSSFIGRSFARRPKRSGWTPHAPAFAELGAARVVSECATTHRAVAMEMTESAIEHLLDLTRKLAQVRRQIEIEKRALDEPAHYRRSQIAEDESVAWQRWLGVIESSVKSAEAEVIAVVRAWESSRRPTDESGDADRGVVHKGRLYLAVPAEDGTHRLAVVDLRSSLNLDGSMAVIDVVSADRLGNPPGPFPIV